MGMIVEDGTGKADANSYVSLDEANAYFVDRNVTAWAALSDAAKIAGLLYATSTIDGSYSWPGYIANQSQALEWPRVGAEDSEARFQDNIVPTKLKQATCEFALLHQTAALNSSFERGGRIKREKVGTLEQEYFDDAESGTGLPIVDKLLLPLTVTGSTSVVEIVRA